MKNRIEIYTDKIYYDEKEIEDVNEVARIIKKHIIHLGKFDIYVIPKPKTVFQKLMKAFGG